MPSPKYNKLKRGAKIPKDLLLLPVRPGGLVQAFFNSCRSFLGCMSFRYILTLSYSTFIINVSHTLWSIFSLPLRVNELRKLVTKSEGVVISSHRQLLTTDTHNHLNYGLTSKPNSQLGNALSIETHLKHNELHPPCVQIKERKTIDYVFKNGSFGKGSFSRSYPCSSLEGESLQLDVYETNFLSSGIDALALRSKRKDYFSPEDFWLLSLSWGSFISSLNASVPGSSSNLDPSNEFLINYVAYHFYRSQKWIVKCGLKYSSNFVLYKDGPMYRHSEFAVFVKGVAKSKASQIGSSKETHFTWQEIYNMSRLCSQVKKKPLICYVFYPEKLANPTFEACISSFEVKSFQFERWSPSKTRE
ncbi:tRNA splicing endonuclease subunit sen2 [Entomophthora muscae]|uniref:tRNA splicing endonuclease subunit sen2 n=1 Tax=Entomophthora muscae TaxID=34485 RepID=A0ACC2TV93_9FUNG|nr:tRNA splicing endonuclease subunit sen2 [Entomophthora muscae]